MITSKLVNQSIEYIMEHLNEEISIEDVADHCHFSKYHFSRVFKAETGESLYSFIKRLKMEQSAVSLKTEKDRTITDIGLDYGYSSSNYSSAFTKHHNVSPAKFRKGVDTFSAPNPFYPGKSAGFSTFEEYDKRVEIKVLSDFTVLYERHLGNYMELAKNWSEFTEKYRDKITEGTLLMERSYADPAITDADQCLYDICMTVDQNCSRENVAVIPGGKFAVYRFNGAVQDIFAAFQGMINVWLANSRYEMNGRYTLGIYRAMNRENMHVEMDLCIPVL